MAARIDRRKQESPLGPVLLAAAIALACGPEGERPPAPPEAAPPVDEVPTAIAPDTRATAETPILLRTERGFLLDGEPISPFGLRVANALQSDEIAARLAPWTTSWPMGCRAWRSPSRAAGTRRAATPQFDAEYRARARRDAEAAFRARGYWFWHAAWHEKADAEGWPRFDKGGAGTADDPGVAFIWDRMRELAER